MFLLILFLIAQGFMNAFLGAFIYFTVRADGKLTRKELQETKVRLTNIKKRQLGKVVK